MARLSGYHCLAPDLPGFGRSNHLEWRSRIDTTDRVAALIEARIPSGRAHVVGLSLGGSVAHALLARHPDLLDRVVIDGCGVLPWWGTALLKAGVAAISPFLHTGPVLGAIARAWNFDEETKADLRAASPLAFRRGFAHANDTRISPEELKASCPTLLVAGERETKPPVRASNAALAALMPNAEARFMPGQGHGWLGQEPDLHVRMVGAWVGGDELPSKLLPETTPWDSRVVERLLSRGSQGR
jgi:pimeloyl-ACP methyl ester carboxylesterase